MPDRADALNTRFDTALAAALRGLPDAAPQPDLWPALAHALDRQRDAVTGATQPAVMPQARAPGRKRNLAYVRRVWLVPAALAAGLALAMLLPRGALQPIEPDIAPTIGEDSPSAGRSSAAVDEDQAGNALDALQQRSQALERWIGATSSHAPQRSGDLMATVEIEDLVGLVDVQLGATHTNDEALLLWRQRVALLEDLATIRSGAYAIAANDSGSLHAVPVSLNRIN